MASATADVVVIGAGVIGCAIARSLTGEGLRVTVLERNRVAAEASGAAAGILAPRVHATDEALFPLALTSHQQFGPLAAELREETGLDVEYARSGVLDLAHDDAHEEALRDKVRWLRGLGHAVEWLDGAQVRAAEPALAPSVRGAFFDADAYHLNPARFTTALARSAALRGATFHFGVEVLGIRGGDHGSARVETTAGAFEAARVVAAAGAWTGQFSEWLGLTIPVYPARGQILTLCAVPPLVRAIIFGLDGYVFPRLDGTVVVGATVERVGFDKSLTAAGVGWLLNIVTALCPGLANAPIDRIWAGLRPASPDDLPIVGKAPGSETLLIATGHHRNGIMLAPVTAQIVSDLVVRGATGVTGAQAITPDRFRSA